MPVPSHPVARLAWEAIRVYVERGEVIEPPADVPPELAGPGGVFVSIKKGKDLRGCIGTVEAKHPTRTEEIISNAINAATMDPRFSPVEISEFDALDVSVDLLGPPEPIEDPGSLDPKRFGVIVSAAGRRALLLPDIEGVDTVERQLDIARRKAGIGPGEAVTVERFEVERYR